MPQGSGDDLEFPIGRWLLWGLVGIAAVALVVLFFIWFADEEDPEGDAGGEVGPQVEWSIELVDQNGDTVTLKGDEPSGRTTETWRNEIQLIRSPGGTFEWDMDERLPAAVVAIDESDGCDALNSELDSWVGEVGTATGEPQQWQARAFAQHTVDTMRTAGCDIDESALQTVTE
jgi:hypothetical protein